MATRKMDALFPKRKSSALSSTKSSKALSAASFKSRDPVYAAHDDIASDGGSVGAVDSQPAALIASGGHLDLNEEYDDVEEVLRQFDMNMAYGPCLGITRLERFERSQRLGLNPPLHVKNILERLGGKPDALWEGRV
ncbi:hypothetical protein M758_2G017600 [Ceratodon purpureus]|nr:hypothetical protein M758_2G017600 [Ceratodon purpureus]